MTAGRETTTRFAAQNSLGLIFSFVLGLVIATIILFNVEIGSFVNERILFTTSQKLEAKMEEEQQNCSKQLTNISASGGVSISGQRWHNISEKHPLEQVRRIQKPPLILLYNPWGRHHWDGMFVQERNEKFSYQPTCPHRCYFTLDREKYQDKADLVLVVPTYSLRTVPNQKKILSTQNKTGQIWAAAVLESSYYHGSAGKAIDGVFHWIGSHRRDADFLWHYGWFYTLKTNPETVLNFEMSASEKRSLTKRKLAAWLVSHCSTQSRRERVVQSLKKYIKVDIYGGCSKNSCPGKQGERKNITDCREFLAQNYKFYLAFENSLCLDYVTEKFFWSYKFRMIPITYGWADYAKIAPPHSYINALDFKSLKELANYILYLDKNDEEYLKYFWWKMNYGLVYRKNPDALCRACGRIRNYTFHNPDKTPRLPRYSSFLRWYASFPKDEKRFKNADVFNLAGKGIRSKSVCIWPNDHKILKNWTYS